MGGFRRKSGKTPIAVVLKLSPSVCSFLHLQCLAGPRYSTVAASGAAVGAQRHAHEGGSVECACRCQIGTCGMYARCTELLGFRAKARNVANSWAQNSDGRPHAIKQWRPSGLCGNCSSRRAAEFSLGPPGVRAGANRTPRRAIRPARLGRGWVEGDQPSDVPT